MKGLIGHFKNFGFYSEWDGKVVEGFFLQRSDNIRCFKKDHSGCWLKNKLGWDTRAIRLPRQVSPSSLTTPCASLPKLFSGLKRMTFPDRGGAFFLGPGYMSSLAALLDRKSNLQIGTRPSLQTQWWERGTGQKVRLYFSI